MTIEKLQKKMEAKHKATVLSMEQKKAIKNLRSVYEKKRDKLLKEYMQKEIKIIDNTKLSLMK